MQAFAIAEFLPHLVAVDMDDGDVGLRFPLAQSVELHRKLITLEMIFKAPMQVVIGFSGSSRLSPNFLRKEPRRTFLDHEVCIIIKISCFAVYFAGQGQSGLGNIHCGENVVLIFL